MLDNVSLPEIPSYRYTAIFCGLATISHKIDLTAYSCNLLLISSSAVEHKFRERERERETDRQTERQRDRERETTYLRQSPTVPVITV